MFIESLLEALREITFQLERQTSRGPSSVVGVRGRVEWEGWLGRTLWRQLGRWYHRREGPERRSNICGRLLWCQNLSLAFTVLDGLAPAHFCNFTLLNLQTSPVLATFKHQHSPATAALSRALPYLHHVNSWCSLDFHHLSFLGQLPKPLGRWKFFILLQCSFLYK